jgi:hypothetical protein
MLVSLPEAGTSYGQERYKSIKMGVTSVIECDNE